MTVLQHVALLSLEPWDETWRRNQHLTASLVEQGLVGRITFVEPPLLGRRGRRFSPLPGVDVVRPVIPLPKRARGFDALGAWLRMTLLRTVDVLWVNAPDLGARCLGRVPALYDVTDDWREFDQPDYIRKRLVVAEDRLARRARTVVCSEVLADRWRARYGVDAAVIHNGVDLSLMIAAEPRPLLGAAPHVGYIGTLHSERLDLELVRRLARDSRIGTVHLIGPNALGDAADGLVKMGIRLGGPVPAREVPGLMASMDVLVSPHVVTPFTLSLDAIKSYEYLATGRPVVATPTSGFQLLQAPALRCVPEEAFVDAVVDAANGPAYAPDLSHDWAVRARDFAAELSAAVSPPA